MCSICEIIGNFNVIEYLISSSHYFFSSMTVWVGLRKRPYLLEIHTETFVDKTLGCYLLTKVVGVDGVWIGWLLGQDD